MFSLSFCFSSPFLSFFPILLLEGQSLKVLLYFCSIRLGSYLDASVPVSGLPDGSIFKRQRSGPPLNDAGRPSPLFPFLSPSSFFSHFSLFTLFSLFSEKRKRRSLSGASFPLSFRKTTPSFVERRSIAREHCRRRREGRLPLSLASLDDSPSPPPLER